MERPKCFPDAGKIDMELDSSDDGADIAQQGSAFPQALLDAADNQSVSSAECPDMHDDLDGLDLEPAEMHSSSDTEALSYRTGSDNGDVGMQLGSSSGEGVSSHCDRDGMELDSSSGQEAEAAVKPAKGWRPGKDCGSFDGFGTPLVQVILANLCLNARRLGSALSKALLRRLLPNDQPAPRRNFADRIVAQMAGVSLSRGRHVYDQVRANDWSPLEDIEHHVDEPSDAQPAFQFSRGCTNKEERSLWAMRVWVVEALHAM